MWGLCSLIPHSKASDYGKYQAIIGVPMAKDCMGNVEDPNQLSLLGPIAVRGECLGWCCP